jgi:hypothetical protein
MNMDIEKVKQYVSQGRGEQLLRISRLLSRRYNKERLQYIEKMANLADDKFARNEYKRTASKEKMKDVPFPNTRKRRSS